ncbi:MAG: DsbA family protein [Xanthobacteraceae bacterium]
MKSGLRLLAAMAFAIAVASAGVAWAQNFSPSQRAEIERIVREYLIKNPDVLKEVIAEAEKQQAAADAEKNRAAIKQHSAAIFRSPHQVTVGNLKGDVTLVEFFDYNCGFCKRALADKLELLKGDPKLRLVLKEFPVLGDGSVKAAQVAVAARMQDPSGKKYFEFHQKLLSSRGPVDQARALAVAKEVGFDIARIERDLGSAEVRSSLEEAFKLADAIGINGTPSYVVGTEVVVGAVGAAALRERINHARCGKVKC